MSSRKKLKMVASNIEVAAGEAARAGEASADFPAAPARPDPEVRALAKRRKFNAAYKLAVLNEVDRLTEPGAIGALLRREALYSSQLTTWRREREAGRGAGSPARTQGVHAGAVRMAPNERVPSANRQAADHRGPKTVRCWSVRRTFAPTGNPERSRPVPQMPRAARAIGRPRRRGIPHQAARCARASAALAPRRRARGDPETLNAPLADATPYTAFARLLDEGTYLASVRTMYRILAASGQSDERRNQLIHPAHVKPELLATGPNQVWTWDITRLRGSLKWQFFYLYVLIDIFSRYVVGWLVAGARERGARSSTDPGNLRQVWRCP
jgi:transposase-like protein